MLFITKDDWEIHNPFSKSFWGYDSRLYSVIEISYDQVFFSVELEMIRVQI